MLFDGGERGRSRDLTINMVKILANYKSGIKIVHINAQSLKNKVDEFRLVFENSGIDVICVSETWLAAPITDDLVRLYGYKIFRSDRGHHGGGVAIFVKIGISCRLCRKSSCTDDFAGRDVEFIFIEILSFGRKVLIGCVYRPNRRVPFNSFYCTLDDLAAEYDELIVSGDFNSNVLVENTLTNNLLSFGLYPVNIINPTHHTSSTSTLIDLFFVSNSINIVHYDQISASCFSKHDLIFLIYDFHTQQSEQYITYRDFKNVDFNIVSEYSSRISWDNIYHMSNVDEQSSFLERNIRHIFDLCVPLKHKKVKPGQKPWFTNAVRNAIQQRDFSFARWKRYRTSELRLEYSIARRNANRVIKNAKTEYYSRRFSSAVNSRQTWNIIRDIGVGSVNNNNVCQVDANVLNKKFTSIPVIPANHNFYNFSSDMINEFNYNFQFSRITQYDVMTTCSLVKSNAVGSDDLHPKFVRILLPLITPYITHLFNTIIMTNVYPLNWKNVKIVPLPKSNGEYRPIAILCFLSKVMEKILYKQMIAYITTHNLLCNVQSGFRQGHSCVTALVEVSENIRQGLEEDCINFLVLLDHSKAFDTVDHNLLISKLKHLYAFSNTSAKLMLSYLSNRTQSVFVDNVWSESLPLTRGVPQGSILGPLLFSLYINDLSEHLSKCKIHLYADDVQLTMSSTLQSITSAVRNLNNELNQIYLWATANGLCLNPAKSKCLIISKKSTIPILPEDITLNDEKIVIVDKAENLGVIFNNSLTWNDHVNSLVGKIYVKLRALWFTQYFTPLKIRILLAKTYLMPSLLYGCELFANCDSVSKRKLNVLYNNIIRYVYCLRRFDHVSSVCNSLYGVSFDNLLRIRTLIFLHRIIYTQSPRYLFNRIRFFQSPRSRNIVIVRHHRLVSEWQFFVHAARLWNNLPLCQQQNNNANSFKTYLYNAFK